jgi:hypothetical protein
MAKKGSQHGKRARDGTIAEPVIATMGKKTSEVSRPERRKIFDVCEFSEMFDEEFKKGGEVS